MTERIINLDCFVDDKKYEIIPPLRPMPNDFVKNYIWGCNFVNMNVVNIIKFGIIGLRKII